MNLRVQYSHTITVYHKKSALYDKGLVVNCRVEDMKVFRIKCWGQNLKSVINT